MVQFTGAAYSEGIEVHECDQVKIRIYGVAKTVADRFLLKGALLFTLWYDMPHRPTRDAELLGFGASALESIRQTFRDIAAINVDDGIIFDAASVSVAEIRKEAAYAGKLKELHKAFKGHCVSVTGKDALVFIGFFN